MSKASDIIRAALAARTLEDALKVNALIAADIGARYERPLADRRANLGLMSAVGSYDHKVIELITNQQDSVLERFALGKYGSLDDVPYATPAEAARDLFAGMSDHEIGDHVTVALFESYPPKDETKTISLVFRDQGVGLTPAAIPRTIFFLGDDKKAKADWQQGSFGVGGAKTYPNAKAIVLVSRRAPEARPDDDRIAVAVVTWDDVGAQRGASYLVTTEWNGPKDEDAEPWSASAADFPDFEPGTHLALLGYPVEGFYRAAQRDERSIDVVANTRLYRPVTPIRLTAWRPRNDYLRGLATQLEKPDSGRPEGHDVLPIALDGTTYHLPVSFYVFNKPRTAGGRDKSVAYGHTVALTSNGQVHHNWDAAEFKARTNLQRISDRVFVVVAIDELPIKLRNRIFTADRQELNASEHARKLQDSLAGFLADWDALREIEHELIREALAASQEGTPGLAIARKISRLMRIKGFSPTSGGGAGSGDGNGKRRKRKREKPSMPLYRDPTMIEGPETVELQQGKTAFLPYDINALDGFIPARATLEVSSSHPSIGSREITVSELREGRLRVSVAVPESAALGEYTLDVRIADWQLSSGGLGPDLLWSTKCTVVDENRNPAPKPQPSNGKGKAGSGPLVAVRWADGSKEGWQPNDPGQIMTVPASVLAQLSEYADLAPLGDQEIPTITMNNEYSFFKTYSQARARQIGKQALDRNKERYAVGVGLGLLYLHEDARKRQKAGEELDDTMLLVARQSVARAVLATMPEFDRIEDETGISAP
jgi:hypothetical protein